MGPLEAEVSKLVEHAYDLQPRVLGVTSGLDPGRPITDRELTMILARTVGGVTQAIQRLARAIDEMQEVD